MEVAQPTDPLTVTFVCNGQATGKISHMLLV